MTARVKTTTPVLDQFTISADQLAAVTGGIGHPLPPGSSPDGYSTAMEAWREGRDNAAALRELQQSHCQVIDSVNAERGRRKKLPRPSFCTPSR